jgi:alpha-beta hydrolase superfamily lysophospholipase
MIFLYIFFGFILLVVLLMLIASFIPFRLNQNFTPNPAKSYAEAIERIAAIRAEEASPDLHPLCATRAFTHGERVQNVIVFLHGFTACPDQFDQLGRLYHEKGYNVYIPRLPRHGDKDPLGISLQGLTAEELAESATQAVDIAQGLGERVVVCGLSGGGTMTMWLSQTRSDVAVAAMIAPFLGIGMIPPFISRALGHLPRLIPDFFVWWDPINKVNNPFAAPYSDTRFPVHAALEILRLSLATQAQARQTRPAAGSLILISNANDNTVNNRDITSFTHIWKAYGEDMVTEFQFNKSHGLPHDVIRPTRPDARVDIVYPKLMELVG